MIKPTDYVGFFLRFHFKPYHYPMESYCSEENSFDIELPNGYTSLHVEYACDEDVATPTGRYFVYMMENDHGTSMFHLQMDDNGQWVSENKPPFLHRSDI